MRNLLRHDDVLVRIGIIHGINLANIAKIFNVIYFYRKMLFYDIFPPKKKQISEGLIVHSINPNCHFRNFQHHSSCLIGNLAFMYVQ